MVNIFRNQKFETKDERLWEISWYRVSGISEGGKENEKARKGEAVFMSYGTVPWFNTCFSSRILRIKLKFAKERRGR